MRRWLKSVTMLVLIMLCMKWQPSVLAKATTVTSKLPITTYTLDGRVDTYGSVNGSYSGYIESYDRCEILKMNDSGWVKVRYPVSNGYKTAYTYSKFFFENVDFLESTIQLGKNMSVYRKSDLSGKIGTVYATDEVIAVGNDGSNTQIIYPVSGGYKMGWIRGIYYNEADGVVTEIEDGYYQIKSAINGEYVLDVYGGNRDNFANVQIYQNCATMNQAYLILRQSDGYYMIQALHSNKVLDVYGGLKENGTNVIQYERNGGDNQLWKIYRTADGYYRFQSKGNGKFLDVYAGIAENENNVHIWENNGTVAQKFELAPVTVDGQAYQKPEVSVREKVVSYLNECATVAWQPQYSFTHWSGGRTWWSGTTYYGIPYSQYTRRTTLEQFKQNMSGTTYIGPSGRSTYLGSDCSSAVSMAYRTVNEAFPITATYYMFPKYSYMKQVGNYYAGALTSSSQICAQNGRNTMYEAYRNLQPGDLLLQTEHVMMVTEVGQDYVKVTHQTTFSSALSSTWRVNEKWSYSSLFNNNYIPVTMKEW